MRRIEGLLWECTRCKRMKPRGNFPRDKSRPQGRSYWCRECRKPMLAAHAVKRRNAPGSGFTLDDVLRLLERQGWRCACPCAGSLYTGYHVDHRIPLARGGINEPGNLQLLTPTCNLRKSAKLE